jgi:hypothetical protein
MTAQLAIAGSARVASAALLVCAALASSVPAGAADDGMASGEWVLARRSPWAEFDRAAREIHREGRDAARRIVRGEQRPARPSRADDDAEEEARSEPERSLPDRMERGALAPERSDVEDAEVHAPGAPPERGRVDRSALFGTLAGLAVAAVAAIAARLQHQRRRRDARADVTSVAATPAPTQPTEATLVEAVAPPKVPRTFEDGPRYEVLERIGAGGMGVVYRARDRRLGRVVALKRLSEQLIDHPKAVKYFLREARAVAGLSHQNIVTLYDVDEEDGVPFLTMELLEGRNLSQIVSAKGALSSADTARVGGQAAAGLACAHRQGIVHRDVKSANLFLTRARVVKVMDFGLATMAEELRRAGTVLGTPQYMAPEQASGRAADHRVDLYALGVTLFHLATGTWPFEDGDVLHHHRHTPAPDPRSRRPDLVPSLAELILACMAKEPEKRPATADDVAARLHAIARS